MFLTLDPLIDVKLKVIYQQFYLFYSPLFKFLDFSFQRRLYFDFKLISCVFSY